MVGALLTCKTTWVSHRGRFCPFLFFLHTDSLASCHSRLLKYVDDFVLGNSYNKDPNQEGLDDDLSRFATMDQDKVR